MSFKIICFQANEAPPRQQRSRSPFQPVGREVSLPKPKVHDAEAPKAGVHLDLVVRDSKGTEIRPGDVLLFSAKREQLMEQLQKGPTGWSEELVGLVLSRALLVIGIRPDGDLAVAVKAFVTGDRTTVTVLRPETTKMLSHADQTGIDADGKHLRKGETVTLLDDEGTFRELQNRPGRNWNDEILPFLGKPVVIQFFDRNGDIRAMIGRMGYLKTFNPRATKKVECVKCSGGRDITVGSSVAVAVPLSELKSLQTEQFGGWKAGMEALLQGTLTIAEISCNVQVETQSPSCMVRVGHHGSDFWLNPVALRQTASPVLVLPQPSPPHEKHQTRPNFGSSTHGGSSLEQPDAAAKKDRKNPTNRPPIPILSQNTTAKQPEKSIREDMELPPSPNDRLPVSAKAPRLV
ncbi:hypothetical protein BV898_15808 [Hypsibius exemplaris]|uniref:Uncharacterized protein n=1 Tax=Hypsibius exemplaris TaxID=2072580 RepID=A0A9X6RL43_HYPEX|nr:hypothetical protein BV898_15808 [Hypsibius exemplaris]